MKTRNQKLNTVPRAILRYWEKWVDKVEKILNDYDMRFNTKMLSISDLEEIAEWDGIECVYSPYLPNKFTSMLYRIDRKIVILINKKKRKRARWFMLGHELGHHFQYMVSHIEREYLGKSYFEKQADIFAYHCFLPDLEMQRIYEKSRKEKERIISAIIKYSIERLDPIDEDKMGQSAKELIEEFAETMYDWYIFRNPDKGKEKQKDLLDFADLRRGLAEE